MLLSEFSPLLLCATKVLFPLPPSGGAGLDRTLQPPALVELGSEHVEQRPDYTVSREQEINYPTAFIWR